MLSPGNTMLCFLEIMLLAALCNSQANLAKSSDRRDIDRTEVEKWVVEFHESLFVKMNPKKTFDNYVYVGKLTNIEAKSAEREWLSFPNKKVPKELKVRYARLNFERPFYEIFFLFGTKKLSNNFSEIDSYDNDAFTGIENLAFAKLLSLELKKSNISKESYTNFFMEDKKLVTRNQVIDIENFFDAFSKLMKSKIDLAIYQDNVANFEKLWNVEGEKEREKYFAVTTEVESPFIVEFIVGKKNGRIQILEFPKFIN